MSVDRTRERVEQAIETIHDALANAIHPTLVKQAKQRAAFESLTTLSNALAESEQERIEMAEALAAWGALALRFGTPTEIHDKLSESEKENERLKVVEAAHNANVKMHGEAQAYYAKLVESEAENERYRKALERIDQRSRTGAAFTSELGTIAREALAGREGKT